MALLASSAQLNFPSDQTVFLRCGSEASVINDSLYKIKEDGR